MKGSRFNAGIFATGAALLLVSSQAFAKVNATLEFESGETRPVSIAVLPVEASIVRAKVVDTDALVEESMMLGALFAAKMQGVLQTKGYTVEVIDAQRINADPQLQEYVVDANRRYAEIRSQVRPKRIKRRIYNAGDEVRLLADYLGVDAVVFSNVNITITPAGKAIVSALVGGSTAGAYAALAVVDGESGDLEAMSGSMAVVLPGDKTTGELEEQVTLLAERAADPMPAADPMKRASRANEEDVLSDIESLLGE